MHSTKAKNPETDRRRSHAPRKAVVKSHADVVVQAVSARLNVERIPKPKDGARRRRSERSALLFMRYYCTACPGAFLRTGIPAEMRKIVHQMQEAVTDGIPYHIRMPRGHGKSSYVKGVTMWAVATGRRKFVEVVAANERKSKSIIRDIWNCMARSPAFMADYPEIGEFIKKCKGNWKRCPSVTFGADRQNVGMKFSVNEANLPMVEIDGAPTPSSGAVMVGVGFAANVRGEVVGCQRPDLIIFDDLQDAKMAASPERVIEARDLINGDFLGSDSHTETSSAFMTSTPIMPDDLSETLARDPYWRTMTYRMLSPFPSSFDPNDESTLWGRFAALWRHEMLNGRDPHVRCNEFYVEHRDEMDAGARVLNPHNFKPNEVSAIEHAMILYYTKGAKSFAAEYQMEPRKQLFAFEITPRIILSRIRADLAEGEVPPGFTFVAAATDINPSYALTTSVIAFDRDRTAVVVKNHITPIRLESSINDTAFIQAVYDALANEGRMIRSWGIPINAWGIDASGKQWDAVVPFAKASLRLTGLPTCAMAGRNEMKMTLYPKSRLRDPINHTVLCGDLARGTKWLFWNSDLYKETAQRSWATEAGAPGGISLHGGVDHDEFAVQVSNERLQFKLSRPDGRNEYKWKTKDPHDYGDCVAMCYAIAANQGIAAGGRATANPMPVARPRKRKVVIR